MVGKRDVLFEAGLSMIERISSSDLMQKCSSNKSHMRDVLSFLIQMPDYPSQ